MSLRPHPCAPARVKRTDTVEKEAHTGSCKTQLGSMRALHEIPHGLPRGPRRPAATADTCVGLCDGRTVS